MYDLYNPLLLKLEVLRLEKRLDEHLLYLKDALPEYSTIPFDMEPESHPEGAPVPVNPIKVGALRLLSRSTEGWFPPAPVACLP